MIEYFRQHPNALDVMNKGYYLMDNEKNMSQSKLFSDELEKFIDQEFAKLKREVTETIANYLCSSELLK